MPKVTKQNEGKGDAMVNTETGEETETMDDVLMPVFSPLGVAELSGKKCEYRKASRPIPLRVMCVVCATACRSALLVAPPRFRRPRREGRKFSFPVSRPLLRLDPSR